MPVRQSRYALLNENTCDEAVWFPNGWLCSGVSMPLNLPQIFFFSPVSTSIASPSMTPITLAVKSAGTSAGDCSDVADGVVVSRGC